MATVSTINGVSPFASLFGGFENQMGLLTHLCFFVVFISVIVGVGQSEQRLQRMLWALSLTGLAVSIYAISQFFGFDPFVSPDLYTFNAAERPIVRVASTIGHADYLGNFLLFTGPATASLALSRRGRARWIALVASALSTVAIACTGTRGAWLGLTLGASTLLALEGRHILAHLVAGGNRKILWAVAAVVTAAGTICIISLSPASHSITSRARLLVTEGLSGSGRLLLWRDSLKMVPAFAITGCGPEGFRKSFLGYKSEELSRLAPQINNESSHNSFLDAAILLGLPGATLYIAAIVSALTLFLGARRRSAHRSAKAVLSGLTASWVAVLIHKLFIFDQIPTGLYFFAFLGLAQATSNVANYGERTRSNTRQKSISKEGKEEEPRHRSPLHLCHLLCVAGTIVASGLLVAAVWYSVALIRADAQIQSAFAFAHAGDLRGVVARGERAVGSPELTGAYDFLFARALVECVDRVRATTNSALAEEDRALNLAAMHAQRSLKHALTPDSSYVLLAYLALASGDAASLKAYAYDAIRSDPNYYITHWLMAEAHLANGDREQAVEEGRLALSLNPSSHEALSVIGRTGVQNNSSESATEELIERCCLLAREGRAGKAVRKINRALCGVSAMRSGCSRALALVYEAAGAFETAIAEWQIFINEDPTEAFREQIPLRVEKLKAKTNVRAY